MSRPEEEEEEEDESVSEEDNTASNEAEGRRDSERRARGKAAARTKCHHQGVRLRSSRKGEKLFSFNEEENHKDCFLLCPDFRQGEGSFLSRSFIHVLIKKDQ